MNTDFKLPKKNLYIILISCAVIISASAIETMIIVKDIDLYNQWIAQIKDINTMDIDSIELLNTYISLNLIQFLTKIIIPMALGIYSYFTFYYSKINRLFIFIWTVLVVGGFAYTFLDFRTASIFYYISILGHMVLIYGIISISSKIESN